MITEPGGIMDAFAVEGSLTARCTITEPPTESAFNETTLQREWLTGAVVYSGPCRLMHRRSDRTERDAGLNLNVDSSTVQVPADVTGLRAEQLVVIDNAPTELAVGLRYEIRRVQPRSAAAVLSIEVTRWVASKSGRATQ